MNQKKLPIYPSPIITYLHYSYELEILLSCKAFWSFFYMNFIQLDFYDFDDQHLEFYVTKLSEQNWLKWSYVFVENLNSTDSSSIDVVIDSINKNYYVKKEVDEYYLPCKDAFNSYHYNHLVQIYGYNLSDKKLYVTGFHKNGRYGNNEISFDDFKKAIIVNDTNKANVAFTLLHRLKEVLNTIEEKEYIVLSRIIDSIEDVPI